MPSEPVSVCELQTADAELSSDLSSTVRDVEGFDHKLSFGTVFRKMYLQAMALLLVSHL